METEELIYCLAKQLPNLASMQSDYGDFELDEELAEAVEKALRPIIQRRIDAINTSKKMLAENEH